MLKDFDFKKFRVDVERLLKPLEEEYGISISGGSVVFKNNKFTLSVCGEKPDEMYDYAKFMSGCRKNGFTPKDYKRELRWCGSTYLFTGFCEDEDAPCEILNVADNKIYLVDSDFVKDNFVKLDTTSVNNAEDVYDDFFE